MSLPRIEQAEFAARRTRLMASLPPHSAVLVPSARMQTRNSDVEYAFRQDSDFYYLTGFDEPDAWLLLWQREDAPSYMLFCQPRDPQMEIWNGYRYGEVGAEREFGADKAYSVNDIDQQMPQLLEGMQALYFCMGSHLNTERSVEGWLASMRAKRRQGVQVPQQLVELGPYLHEMRLIKSETELAVMRAAGQVSAQAHALAMQTCTPGHFEYQLEATIMHHFAQHGCRQPAYSTIVGSGANACVLHYIANKDPLREGDLVLIDAGCELDYYAADITRTFPVSGTFSEPQKQLYELVLAAMEACFAVIRPGTAFEAVHDASVRVIAQGLIDLGILHGTLDEVISTGAYKTFYMHRAGHWLGMDVHDVGDYKINGESRPLEPGMVMTVEPGIYIAPDAPNVDPKWRGIGIRIEDDVVVTETGFENLTVSVPKTVAEIEALMAKAVEWA